MRLIMAETLLYQLSLPWGFGKAQQHHHRFFSDTSSCYPSRKKIATFQSFQHESKVFTAYKRKILAIKSASTNAHKLCNSFHCRNLYKLISVVIVSERSKASWEKDWFVLGLRKARKTTIKNHYNFPARQNAHEEHCFPHNHLLVSSLP